MVAPEGRLPSMEGTPAVTIGSDVRRRGWSKNSEVLCRRTATHPFPSWERVQQVFLLQGVLDQPGSAGATVAASIRQERACTASVTYTGRCRCSYCRGYWRKAAVLSRFVLTGSTANRAVCRPVCATGVRELSRFA